MVLKKERKRCCLWFGKRPLLLIIREREIRGQLFVCEERKTVHCKERRERERERKLKILRYI